ncbi:MAG: dihydrodipicolinate synthase family protein [Planctomycetia bacterium]|nr:dihydrodipicolinate synthase family protein [Planctomycetia bacterium]
MDASPRLTPAHFQRSVMAVPPLARTADGAIDPAANTAIIRHIEAGGISLLLYGGNANIYHLPLEEYEPLLVMLAEAASPSTLVVPSAGPTYGLLLEQAKVFRRHRYQTVMVLPQQGITTSGGVATGVRKFVEAAGLPALLYIKHDGYIEPADVAKLCNDGLVSAIKYATVRPDPAHDPYLRELVGLVDPRMIISGIGEQPAIIHLRDFGLGGFTTGCGCVAPRLSQMLLKAIQRGDWAEAERIRGVFEPLEDLRNALSPIRVLHAAVAAAGIAATGPLAPLLSPIEDAHRPAIAAAARSLLQAVAVTTGSIQ